MSRESVLAPSDSSYVKLQFLENLRKNLKILFAFVDI